MIFDVRKVPLDDPYVWDLISNGLTKGLFQLESSLGKIWSTKIKPSCIEDLAAIVSLVRPGCLRAFSGNPPKSMTQRYCDRKNGTEPVEFYHESLEPILRSTYGVLVYQEQAMQIAQAIAGFDLQQADVLRKAIGKKKADVMAKVKGEFLEGCKKAGIVTEEQAAEIFGWIQESQRYSFNKSHAVSYAIDSYWSAYCKAYHNLQFYCSYLRGSHWKQDPQEEVNQLIDDMLRSQLGILTPDFRYNEEFTHIHCESLRFGLGDIKQVGEAARIKIERGKVEAEALIGCKVEKWCWLDYLFYFSDKISSTTNQGLIAAGALDYLNRTRNEMLYEFDIYNKLTEKEKSWIQLTRRPWKSLAEAMTDCSGEGCKQKRRKEVVAGLVQSLVKPPHALIDKPEWIAWIEEKYLGVPITYSRVDGRVGRLESNTSCREFLDGKNGYMVLAVEVKRAKEVLTKRGDNPGQRMAFVDVSDGTGTIEGAVIFPAQWTAVKGYFVEKNTILIHGERDKMRGSMVIKSVQQI